MSHRPRVEHVDVPFPDLDGTQACADVDPEVFFPHDSDDRAITVAKAVCSGCPFQRPCLAYALTHHVTGIWGATTTDERRSLRRRHGIGLTPEPRHRLTVEPASTEPAPTDPDWS